MTRFSPDGLVSSFISDDIGTTQFLEHSTEQHEAPTIPPVSAITEWNAAISAAMASGKNKSHATRQVMIGDPDLHQRFLAEFNAKKPAAKAAAPSPAIREWDAAIASQQAKGMNKSQAIRAVVNGNPDLHSRYLIAVNERKN